MDIYLCIALVISLASDSTQSLASGIGLFQPNINRAEQAIAASHQQANPVLNLVDTYIQNRKKAVDAYYENLRKNIENIKSPDITLSVPSIITRNGYSCETHTVVSQGYMLNIHRIPRSKSGGDIQKNTVILQHGLFGSSADWILNGPEKGLAYVLANAGYDVWMLNIRGNKYSKEHAVLKGESKTFWNFSWHDVALYDLPAVIDHVVKQKGKDAKITYMGHSMGTTILFAMLTLRPEYNAILNAGFALAPVAFFSDIKSPAKAFAPSISRYALLSMTFGIHDVLPKNSVLGQRINYCYVGLLVPAICKNVIFSIFGSNEKQFNETVFHTYMNHFGTGTSWKTGIHYAQEVLADKFQQFDYGKNDNLKVYGVEQPPEYDLSKITLPIKLFWAENDLVTSEKDVRRLYDKLPSTTQIYKVPDPKFTHIDFLWAIDAPTLINEEILKSLKSTESNELF